MHIVENLRNIEKKKNRDHQQALTQIELLLIFSHLSFQTSFNIYKCRGAWLSQFTEHKYLDGEGGAPELEPTLGVMIT